MEANRQVALERSGELNFLRGGAKNRKMDTRFNSGKEEMWRSFLSCRDCDRWAERYS